MPPSANAAPQIALGKAAPFKRNDEMLEALADRQKSAFKAKNPSRFCDAGLYRLVRSPNYFGEMVFWLGTFVAGLGAYRAPLDWLIALEWMPETQPRIDFPA